MHLVFKTEKQPGDFWLNLGIDSDDSVGSIKQRFKVISEFKELPLISLDIDAWGDRRLS